MRNAQEDCRLEAETVSGGVRRIMRGIKLLSCCMGLALAASLGLAQKSKGDATKGKELFEQCGVCHNADSDEKKMGPGLKGLFKKDKMADGKKPTEANVKEKINTGGNGMPAYQEMLTDEEREHLMAYLRTL
jgi:cytochrome c